LRSYWFQSRPGILQRAREHPPDPPILHVADLDRVEREEGPAPAREWVGTWVITASDGLFRCGSRRREHVDIAGGDEVLAAGEVWFAFDRRRKSWIVARITNRSIGFRIPLPESYEAVREAFQRIGLEHASVTYDETYVGAHCPEHDLQVLRLGEPLECKVCFGPVQPVHSS
jgi:hypothetical protein